jgi:hypothetical protein
MRTEGQWIKLLEEIGDALHAAFERLSRAGVGGRTDARFFSIFVLQATQDTHAIASLYKATLKETTQSLVRALLECRFNFDVFVLRYLRDPNGTIRLMLDAMMLEKIRQAEASNFAGLDLITGAPTPDDFRAHEKGNSITTFVGRSHEALTIRILVNVC